MISEERLIELLRDLPDGEPPPGWEERAQEAFRRTRRSHRVRHALRAVGAGVDTVLRWLLRRVR